MITITRTFTFDESVKDLLPPRPVATDISEEKHGVLLLAILLDFQNKIQFGRDCVHAFNISKQFPEAITAVMVRKDNADMVVEFVADATVQTISEKDYHALVCLQVFAGPFIDKVEGSLLRAFLLKNKRPYTDGYLIGLSHFYANAILETPKVPELETEESWVVYKDEGGVIRFRRN
jgi:hypothetical protein